MFDHPAFDAHEGVHMFHDAETGLRGIIAIHSTALGPAAGGCRMWNYQTGDAMLADVLRLSQGMSYKNAMADLPLGGGKAVIWGDSKTDKTPELFRAFGRAIESLNGTYYTAEDVGISPEDLEYAREETRYVAGLDTGSAASGNPSPVTAEGVYRGIRVALGHVFNNDDPRGRKIAVQGVGQVGEKVARKLARDGAELIIADFVTERAESLASELGARVADKEAILFEDVDVVSPNALGAVLNEVSVAKLKCRIVAGGANNQLSVPKIGDQLAEAGILYAPDYVINGGGIINVAAEISGTYDSELVQSKLVKLMLTLEEVFTKSSQEKRATNRVADDMARQKIGR